MAKSEKHLTDEQRVVLWLAKRGSVLRWNGKRTFTTADVQGECDIHWRYHRVYRMPSTWLRAMWRAAAAGMLGTVTRSDKRVNGLYVYSYTATKRELMRAAGVEYKTIKHGKPKPRLGVK